MKRIFRRVTVIFGLTFVHACFACPTSIQHYDYLIHNQGAVTPDQIKTLISQCRFEQQLLTNIDTMKPSVCPPDSSQTGRTQAAGCDNLLTDEQLLELFHGKH